MKGFLCFLCFFYFLPLAPSSATNYTMVIKRDPLSHKGENGKVAVIGGSLHMHGAPLFSLLAAEASGVDVLFILLPACHAEAAKAHCLNAQVYPFRGDDLSSDDVDRALELLATVDCAVIGPGLARDDATLKAMRSIIASASCPLVLDASALQPDSVHLVRNRPVVLTPHRGELERMAIQPSHIAETARNFGVVIHYKGPSDQIADREGHLTTIDGGNAGLTVGGTGDVLAGLIAGLIAQGLELVDACTTASETLKRAGDVLFDRSGFAYRALDIIHCIPGFLRRTHAPDDAPPEHRILIA